MEVVSDWEALSKELNIDRRAGIRVNLKFPIEVSGFSRPGTLFVECTETSDISESGCRFALKETVNRGDVIAIKLLNRQSENGGAARAELFQIVWRACQDEIWSIGALKLRNEKFWEVNFPPKPRNDTSP